jgi:hypothetical protein
MTISAVVVLLLGVAATIGMLFLSRPKRTRLAWCTVAIILIQAFWQAWGLYQQDRVHTQLERRAIERISIHTQVYLGVLASILTRGSHSWVPDSETKFFSKRSAEILCSETDILSNSIGIDGPLYARLAYASESYHHELQNLLDSSGAHMPPELLSAISEVEASQLFSIIRNHRALIDWRARHNIHSPPLLCWGLEPLMADSLHSLGRMVKLLRTEEERFGIYPAYDWLKYPPYYLAKFQGINRFGPERLDSFLKLHPDSPGPATFGRGDPSKTPILDPRSGPWGAKR